MLGLNKANKRIEGFRGEVEVLSQQPKIDGRI